MDPYGVTFDITRPEKFEKGQVIMRIIVYIFLGWVPAVAYFALPIMAALGVSSKGSQRFLAEDGERMKHWVAVLTGLMAFMYSASDKLSFDKPEEAIRLEIQTRGTPSVGSALLRIFLSIPSFIVLGVLGWVAGIIWLIATVMILVQDNYPEDLFNFLRGYLRWTARLLAYHSSLVDGYPPFALDNAPATA